MVEELIDEIDWDGNTVAVRPAADLKNGMFPHKVSLVIPRSKDGKFVFAKRAVDKQPYPGVWCCGIGGKVAFGESNLQAAKRESREEARMNLPLELITDVYFNGADEQARFFVYTTTRAVDHLKLKPDPREIQYFESFSLEEMVRMSRLAPNSVAPTFRKALYAFSDAIAERNSGSI